MSLSDAVWMVLIMGGAILILYRTFWKNKGRCHGCNSGTCSVGKEVHTRRLK